MYDFCFTLPYGAIVLLGGLMGGLKGSTASVVAGGGSGLVLLVLGYLSMQEYNSQPKRLSTRWSVCSLFVSSLLVLAMGKRYLATNKFMPAGLVCAMSLAMSVFYIWQVASFIPRKNAQRRNAK